MLAPQVSVTLMANSKSNFNHAAVALLAVVALVGNYEAFASEQPSQSVLAPFLSAEDPVSAMSAFETEHRDAIRKLRASAATSAAANQYAIARGFPKHMLTDEQAKNIAILMLGIRKTEADIKRLPVPVGLEELHAQLRRALAEARSEIVVTFEMVRQIRGTPESIEGRIDMAGLKALADRSTEKLLKLASA